MDLKLHLVAPTDYGNLKSALEKATEYNGQPLNISIVNWDYSLNGLCYWAVEKQEGDQPDVILVFDAASYKRVDSKTDETLLYKDFIDNLKTVQLSVNSKIVLVLSKEKEENLELLNELIKLNIQNFFFAKDKFTIQDILMWLLTEKTLKDNEKYLITGKGDKKTQVFRQVEKQTEIKEVEKIIEKKVIETRTEYIETKKVVGYSRKVFCIPGNTEFASEMAYITAKAMPGFKVGLINLDPLGYVDVVFNLVGENGLSIITKIITDGKMPTYEDWEGAKAKTKLPENLYILTEEFNNKNNYDEELLKKLINYAHNYFDALYIIVPMDKHSITFKTLVNSSHIVFMAARASIHNMRGINLIAEDVPSEKLWYILWAYNSSTDLSVSIFKKSMIKNQYAGKVDYSAEREKVLNTGDISYAEVAYKYHYRQYFKILRRFKLLLPSQKGAGSFFKRRKRA